MLTAKSFGKADFLLPLLSTMTQNEQDIWNQIQQKDVAAFERYYKDQYKRFFLMACKYLKDPEQAQEVVNDVFMKIWQEGAQLVITSSLTSYVYRAIINKCINILKKAQKERMLQKEFGSYQEESYQLQVIEENELRIKIYQAIDQLPEQCKKVFQLSRFEALKQQEIADKLGISVKTVKNHITHALKLLSKHFGEHIVLLMLLINKFF